jgi:hypothetical protein
MLYVVCELCEKGGRSDTGLDICEMRNNSRSIIPVTIEVQGECLGVLIVRTGLHVTRL